MMSRIFLILVLLSGLWAEEISFSADSVLYLGGQVIPGSVVILCGEDTIAHNNFSVAVSGTVRIFTPLPCDSVKVAFVPMGKIYPPAESHYRMWGTGKIPAQIQTETDTSTEGINFRTSGSLLRGLRISNTGNVNSTSSLNFRAEGDLAGDVHISALLSDEGSPIQPEGNSLQLSELDKVLIQLRSPHINASFGDIDLTFPGGDFLNISRRIQGVEASAEYSAVSVRGFGSLMRGKFNSVEFSASEGNQGPYPLWGQNGERDIVILAGSERVWLNGEPMRRGEDNDYVMDYNLAQITFTNRHPLSADDRIVVDFQYIAQDYAQTFFGVGGTVKPTKNTEFGVYSVWRNDDTHNPLTEISDSVRRVLSACGDSVPDSLSAPQYLQITAIKTGFSLGKLRVAGEYSISDFDRNKFSQLDDGDNFGDAFTAAGTLTVARGVALFGAGRFISSRYHSIGRIDPPEFDRNWNLSADSLADDKILQSGVNLDFEKLNLTLWAGKRWAGAGQSRRVNLSGEYIFAESDQLGFSGNYAADSASSRGNAKAKFKIKVLPAVELAAQTDIGGFSHRVEADTLTGDASSDIGFDLGKHRFTLHCGIESRRIRRRIEWGDFSRSLELGAGWSFSAGSITITRRFFNAIDSAAGEDLISDLANLSLAGKVLGANLSGKYQLSRSQAEKLEKVYRYVGEGEGSYRWDDQLGEYVPDPEGDYILEYRATGEFSPVVKSDFAFLLSGDIDFVPLGGAFSGEVSFHSENKCGKISSYYLNPRTMFTDDSLNSGTFSASAQMTLLRKSPVNLVLSSSYRKTAYRVYTSGAEFSQSAENSLSLSGTPFFKILTSLEGGVENERNFRPSLSRWVDARSYFAKISMSRKIADFFRLKISGQGKKITDYGTEPTTDAALLTAKVEPSLFFKKFVLTSSGEMANLTSSEAILPYELSEGWYVGTNWRWDTKLTYRAGAKTEFSIIYRGEKKPNTDTKHTAEARVRLIF